MIRQRQALGGVLAVAIVLSLVTAPIAVAQSDETPDVDHLLDERDNRFIPDWASDLWHAASGWASGVANGVTDRVMGGEEWTPTEAASDFQSEINDNSETYETFINNRTTASESRDVVAIVFTDGDENETMYLTGDVEGEDYANVSVVGSTDREVDLKCTLEGSAARNAADEMGELREEYISDGDPIDRDRAAKIWGKYKSGIECEE